MMTQVLIRDVTREIEKFFRVHPVALNKKLVIQGDIPDTQISTDISLLYRVLNNMVLNAFEATELNGEVQFWLKRNQIA